jgi:hypothetical protein
VKITKTVTKEVEEVVDHICNKCGRSCKKGDEYEGLINTTVYFGYYSNNRDGEKYNFSLCEDCTVELMNSFSIAAEKEFWDDGKSLLQMLGVTK